MSDTRSILKKHFDEKGYYFLRGTFTGIFARWATWPAEYIYTVYSFPENKKTYPQLYKEVSNLKELRELNSSFWRTGFRQTIGKSFSNSGVLDFVDHYAKQHSISPLQKGLLASFLCSPLETALITPGETAKVRSFSSKQQGKTFKEQNIAFSLRQRVQNFHSDVFTKEFGRIFTASFARSLWTSCTTFISIYQTVSWLRPIFPKEYQSDKYVQPIAAGLAAFCIQPANIGAINYLTFVIRNPELSLSESRKKFFGSGTTFFDKDARTKMFRGSLGRCGYSSTRYFVNFLFLEFLKSLEKSVETSQELSRQRINGR